MSFLSTNKNYKRLYSAPLDVTSVFDTKSELDEYLNNPTAYVGQVISCKETDLVYLIKSDKTLLEIGKKEEPVIQNGMMIHSASDDKYYYYDNSTIIRPCTHRSGSGRRKNNRWYHHPRFG